MERERILDQNTKVYEVEYFELVKQDNILKEKDLMYQKMEIGILEKEKDLDKKAAEFEVFWRELDKQRHDVVELASGIESSLENLTQNLELLIHNLDMEKGVDLVEYLEYFKKIGSDTHNYIKNLKSIESKYKILVDDNKSATISKVTGNDEFEKECTTDRKKFDTEIDDYIDKVKVETPYDVEFTVEKQSKIATHNSNSTFNNLKDNQQQSFDMLINREKDTISQTSNENHEIVLKEEEYLALVNENQELIDKLAVVRDQLTTLKEKHINLMEGINLSLTTDSNKIELKLDDCLDFIRKSNESTNIDNML